MNRVRFQPLGGLARRPFQRMLVLASSMGLALLMYCCVQNREDFDLIPVSSPPATVPSENPTDPTAVYVLVPGSEVLLQGTTNISDWSSRSSQPTARVTLHADDAALQTLFDKLQTGPIPADQLRLPVDSPATADLSVPVISLHGDSQGMDRDMRSALKAQQFPLIQYRLKKIQGAKADRDPATGKPTFQLQVSGTLTVAGVQRTLDTELTIQRDAARHYLVHARIPIRMTDFGVTPPTAFFGLIHAKDLLSVIFNLDFVPVAAIETPK